MEKISVMNFIIAVLCLTATNFVCYGQTHLLICSKSELEALSDFKNSLNDPENRLSSWKGHNCCRWRGIECETTNGAVISIDLHNPYPIDSDSVTKYGFWNLSGEISPSLVKLESLKHLDLSGNTFVDIPIPEFVGSFRNLEFLNLSNSGFVGKISPNFGNLSKLQYLDLSSLSLTVETLQWASGLVSLEYLEMKETDLSLVGPNWIEVLNTLPYLTELHLSVCGLSSFGSSISTSNINLTSLSVVDLSLNGFSSSIPDWFVNLTSLVYLDMSLCSLRGRVPISLGQLPSLKFLKLDSNGNLSASCHELFGLGWRKIEYLGLFGNNLHGKLPSSIGNMTSLTYINLGANNIEGGIPSSIGKLCNLIIFFLSGNKLNESLPELLEVSESCGTKSPLPNLIEFLLSNNKLVGRLPEWLGHLRNLEDLALNYNKFMGLIPTSLGKLRNLTYMGLGGNVLNGTLPESIGQLSRLTFFDVSSNQLTGVISEQHFVRLNKLVILHLSDNSFVLNVSSKWIPPFQIGNLDMGSCRLGPLFPVWLKSQKELRFLNFANTSITGLVPSWFWDISSNLSLLNISLNHLEGILPNPLNIAPYADVDLRSNKFEGPIPLPIVPIELLDLSNNQFSGPIPENMSESMPELIYLSLANNQLSGNIPESIGDMLLLQVIELSDNNLTGKIPSSIGSCSYLMALDLGNNRLYGIIPESLGKLEQLKSLHLSSNYFSGPFPPSFRNLSSIETLDLGYNKLSGKIPSWVGNDFPFLRIISLRSNDFYGEIPFINLTSLQILDFAVNNLSGNIPTSLGGLKSIQGDQKTNKYLFYGFYRGQYFQESFIVNLKGSSQKFTKNLALITSVDLSSNSLLGTFPEDLTNLTGLVVLNLSRNYIVGQIPEGISRMHNLGSLDLSNNKISGLIPQTMSSLSFLGSLNLSYNDLSGQIPSGHLSTFPNSSFYGNLGLCGYPLVDCKGEDPNDVKNSGENEDSDDGFINEWVYLSVGLGFVAGIVVPYLIIALRKPWSETYFSFVDKIVLVLLWVRNSGAKKSIKKIRRR